MSLQNRSELKGFSIPHRFALLEKKEQEGDSGTASQTWNFSADEWAVIQEERRKQWLQTLQEVAAALPFGGVRESGMGSYHGKAGFLTFSHQRAVLRRPFWLDLPFRYPPYAGKLALMKWLLG